MALEARVTELERRLGGDGDDRAPVVVVDHLERGPSDPVERTAWLQSQIPPGARNVMIIRVVYEDRDEHCLSRSS